MDFDIDKWFWWLRDPKAPLPPPAVTYMLCAVEERDMRRMFENEHVDPDMVGYPSYWWIGLDGAERYWPVPADNVEIVSPTNDQRAFRLKR